MGVWFAVLFALYAVSLAYCALLSRQINVKTPEDFLTSRSNIGAILGFLTFSATLFSTFTLMGMPNFFRVHGVGAWIFLGVTDAAMAFVVLWFGLALRKRLPNKKYTSVYKLLTETYSTKYAGTVYLLGIFIFLLPYVSIQIRGVATMMASSAPVSAPLWVWSFGILLVMLFYSGIGGLRAIIYSDVIQGITLLLVTWFIAIVCLTKFGGVESLFTQVRATNIDLLSTPGPKSLFSAQFLVASFLAIALMPITQPQLTTRIGIIKNSYELRKMSVAIGVFSIAVILPTAVIGMYGAVSYQELASTDFLQRVLVADQPHFIGALSLVGLLAASMSTADSQIFALGSEVESSFTNNRSSSLWRVKLIIILFALAALILALRSSNELVLMARVSFAGTSLLAPMILLSITTKEKQGKTIPLLTFIALVLFLLSSLKIVPSTIFSIRLDLALLLTLASTSFLFKWNDKRCFH